MSPATKCPLEFDRNSKCMACAFTNEGKKVWVTFLFVSGNGTSAEKARTYAYNEGGDRIKLGKHVNFDTISKEFGVIKVTAANFLNRALPIWENVGKFSLKYSQGKSGAASQANDTSSDVQMSDTASLPDAAASLYEAASLLDATFLSNEMMDNQSGEGHDTLMRDHSSVQKKRPVSRNAATPPSKKAKQKDDPTEAQVTKSAETNSVRPKDKDLRDNLLKSLDELESAIHAMEALIPVGQRI